VSARPPTAIVAIAAITIAFFMAPLLALAWRAPWSQMSTILTDDATLQALTLSLWCSVWAALLSLVFGVPLAWVLARQRFPGRRLARALCTLSMVLPPVVGGVALLAVLGRRGVVGRYLDQWFGVQLPFTTVGAVVAQTFVAMPFLVVTVEAALSQLDLRSEEAAATLGATGFYSFRRVVLPQIRPALVAGTALAWARALGEFGATITFAGNFPGRTQTLPLAVYLNLESSQPRAIALALLLVVISLVVLVGLRDRWWRPSAAVAYSAAASRVRP
jgi:molybdate transport system permease protein